MSGDYKSGPVGFNIVAELGASRQLSVGGNFGPEASLDDINATLDKVLKAINRQQAKSGIINLEAEIASMERNLRNMREDVERLDKRQGNKPLSAQERQQREAVVINIGRLEDDIDIKRGFLAECQRDAA